MPAIETLRDIEQRLERNGGNATRVSAYEMSLLGAWRGDTVLCNHEGQIGRRYLAWIKRTRKETKWAIKECVTFAFTPVPWIDRTLQKHQVEGMDDDHIRNIVAMIESGRMKRAACSGLTNAQWVDVFRAELIVRHVKRVQERVDKAYKTVDLNSTV